jgi:hypothetical protein
MIFFLSSADEEMDLRSARAVIRARHGLAAEQELRAFVAGLEIKERTHEVQEIKGEPHRFQVESSTAPGEHYVVCLEDFTCPCKGWSVRKWCSHLDDAIDFFRTRRNEATRTDEVPF